MQVLDRGSWVVRAEAHSARIDAYITPHLDLRRDAIKHPVHDFLFTYYSQRPVQLRRWHPGYGSQLLDAPEYADLKGYADGAVTAAYVASQEQVLTSIHRLLVATAERTASFGCFGLHEWAMVYRLDGAHVRHSSWPLRLGTAGTDAVVESHRITCSHFDAFRFFTEPARPLNTLQPARDDRPAFEQPGCLHAGMDLYKHAFRLTPMICSDLVVDAFELAWEIRALDMRASPYDLSGLDPAAGEDWSPIPIETAEGKAAYASAQREFTARAAPIRAALIAECVRLLGR